MFFSHFHPIDGLLATCPNISLVFEVMMTFRGSACPWIRHHVTIVRLAGLFW
jgi:hypothetical protein